MTNISNTSLYIISNFLGLGLPCSFVYLRMYFMASLNERRYDCDNWSFQWIMSHFITSLNFLDAVQFPSSSFLRHGCIANSYLDFVCPSSSFSEVRGNPADKEVCKD